MPEPIEEPSINSVETPITFELNQGILALTLAINDGPPRDIRDGIAVLDEKINLVQRALGKIERQINGHS